MSETYAEWWEKNKCFAIVDETGKPTNQGKLHNCWTHQQAKIDKLIHNGYICSGAKGTQPVNECCGGCLGCIEMQMCHSMSEQAKVRDSLQSRLDKAVELLEEFEKTYSLVIDGFECDNLRAVENISEMSRQTLQEIKEAK